MRSDQNFDKFKQKISISVQEGVVSEPGDKAEDTGWMLQPPKFSPLPSHHFFFFFFKIVSCRSVMVRFKLVHGASVRLVAKTIKKNQKPLI